MKFTYKEIEEALLELDIAPSREKDDAPGDYVEYLFDEGRPEQITYFLEQNGFINKNRTVEVDFEKLPLIKAASRAERRLGKTIRKHYPDLDLQGNVDLRKSLQEHEHPYWNKK